MARKKINNELWKALQPLLPTVEPSAKDGRPRVNDQAVLNGILFALHTGIPCEDLPQELGFGSGMTCWRRLRDWQASGVWAHLHMALLTRLREHDQIDWSRASIDGAAVASPRGGQQTGPNPTDRGSIAGLLNGLTPGLPRSASSIFVSSVASISILLRSRSPALSSAPDSLRSFVSGSYSGWMFAALIMRPHLADSCAWNFASSAGELVNTSVPVVW